MAYQTVSFLNRALTPDEITTYTNYLAAEMEAGNYDGVAIQMNIDPSGLESQLRIWQTQASAQAFVNFLQTFDPPFPNAWVVPPLGTARTQPFWPAVT